MDILEIATVIRKKRDAFGLSQSDLSFRTGLHIRSIHNVESGKGNPSINTLIKLCEVLDLQIIIR